jgi:hypothetical protein
MYPSALRMSQSVPGAPHPGLALVPFACPGVPPTVCTSPQHGPEKPPQLLPAALPLIHAPDWEIGFSVAGNAVLYEFPVALIPVPESATVSGEPVAPVKAIFSVADSTPAIEGLNFFITVQVPPLAATVPEHVVTVVGKSRRFVPVVVTDEIVIAEAVELVRVTICVALDDPTLTFPKASLDGETVTVGVAPPTSGCG